MYNKSTSRFALTALMALTACLSMNAQADVAPDPAATITFTVADNIQLSKAANPVLHIQAVVADPASIQTVRLSSPVGSGVGHLNGCACATIGTTFFAGYYPVGDYTFTTTVTNMKNVRTIKSITVHLNP